MITVFITAISLILTHVFCHSGLIIASTADISLVLHLRSHNNSIPFLCVPSAPRPNSLRELNAKKESVGGERGESFYKERWT